MVSEKTLMHVQMNATRRSFLVQSELLVMSGPFLSNEIRQHATPD